MSYQIKEDLKQLLTHADGIGDYLADRVAVEMSHKVDGVNQFIYLIYEDQSFRDSVTNIDSVGSSALESVVELSQSIINNEAVVVRDNFGKVRVVKSGREEEFV